VAAETPPPPSIETLLAEREWLRRVARALADDEAAADDLEQDAWLAAMRRPPDAVGAARAWFRRVLTNRAGEVHRGRGRRRSREEAASRPEAVPSTADIVARAEAQRRVVEAVFALPEPWKTTVLLRYFEDLDTGAIAARMGVPADTVRVRLRKATDDLRRALAPRDRETRAAWMLVLGLPAPRSLNVAPTLGGGVLVSTGMKLAAAAVVLAALGLTFWALSDGNSPIGSRATAAGSDLPGGKTSSTANPTAAAAPRQSDGAATTSALPSAGDSPSLAGEVRLAEGDAPASEVDVVLCVGASQRRTQTDARGAFHFDAAPANESLTVTATRRSMTARATGIRLERGEARRLDTLWLDAPVRIRAEVVGPSLEPIAGATVEAYRVRAHLDRQEWNAQSPEPDFTETTDEHGAASFADATVGIWRLRATHPEFAPAGSGDVRALRGGVDAVVRLRMEHGSSLEGRVRTLGGAPVADARVLLLPPVAAEDLMEPVPVDVRRLETKTDAEGRYRFAAVPAGDRSLAVARPGSLPARIGIVTIPAVRVFDAVLDGGVLAGRVTAAEDGTPIEGARIRAAVWRRHSPTFLTATTAADGR
jgi:RNA polymerase sigma factor (sigma-70 family)